MPANFLHLNAKKISYDEIKDGNIRGDTPFELSTLTFCRQWLNGQGLFSLKTSGSTGAPKTITVSRYQMHLSAQQTIGYFNLQPEDTVLVCLNTAYIAGIMMLVRALESGASIIAVEPSGNPLLEVNTKVNFMAVVPLQLQQILGKDETKTKIESCRATIVGGAHVSVKLTEELQKTTATIYATFGMTETLTHFALKELNPVHEDYFTVFDKVIIGRDSRDCLTVESEITEHRKLITNDLVEILSVNTFKWLGRIDNAINSAGIKLQVETLESKVEQAFQAMKIANRFFIMPMPDEQFGEKVVLVVESATSLDILDSLDWTPYLQPYEKPKAIIYLESFAETPTGKIDRKDIIKTLQN